MHAYYSSRSESMDCSLRQRNNGNVKKDNNSDDNDEKKNKNFNDCDQLNLMEQLMIMSLRKQTTTLLSINVTNEKISVILRGALLIELGLKGYLELDGRGCLRKKLSDRNIIVIKKDKISDFLMNQCINYISKYNGKYSIKSWLLFLSGQSLNFMMINSHIKLMREKLCKNLVDKGILECGLQTNFIFKMHNFKFRSREEQNKILLLFQRGLLSEYKPDYTKYDSKVLALIFLTYAGEIENLPTECLNEDDYVRAINNLYSIKDSNFNEIARSVDNKFGDLYWGVFDAIKQLFNL
ncbi:Golgi phosphoprotein 3 [Strongyloides ratti]|uniref:Golgi phosphoprotein 3 n=1 Tax=Strongyloides ratti TaxID=34506 RepID=A0A090LQV5_STRRB|nr:Golgi phosphoprotein 3 [Strongyloides ratti]CEF69976.1 Golgi phosphoprotein 3 [Strongyloides ratti]